MNDPAPVPPKTVTKPIDRDGWQPASSAPIGRWVRTKRQGEAGENICALHIWPAHLGGEHEWIEQLGGRTTITHQAFAAPTHWRPL